MALFRDNRPAFGSAVRRAAVAASAAVALLGPVPATAQWLADDPMPPRAVTRILARQGFTELSAPRLAGDVYVVPAVDEGGARVRLVIDAYSGRILRQVGVSVERLPPRPVHRLRPWDYTPEPDYEVERESIESYRERRWSRDDLVPPARVGRSPAPELPLSRDAAIDLDRQPAESTRPRPVERDKRPAAARNEPARPAARVEQPAREAVSPVQPTRSPGDEHATSVVPAPAEPSVSPTDAAAAKPSDAKPSDAKPSDAKLGDAKLGDVKPGDAKPAVSAAAPAPAVAKEESAPAPTGDKPELAQPGNPAAPRESAVAQQPRKAQTAARAAEPPPARDSGPGKVRIIGGVAPIVPQKPGSTDDGSSSEPSKIAE